MTAGTEEEGWDEATEMMADITTKFEGEQIVVVGAYAEYAAYVEFGTSEMRAQPYLRPAFRDAKIRMPFIVAEAGDKSDPNQYIANEMGRIIERQAKFYVPVDTGNLKRSIRHIEL